MSALTGPLEEPLVSRHALFSTVQEVEQRLQTEGCVWINHLQGGHVLKTNKLVRLVCNFQFQIFLTS